MRGGTVQINWHDTTPVLTLDFHPLSGEDDVRQLVPKEKLGKMLDEDPSLMEKRETLAKRLMLYKTTRDDIDAVAWK